jgi:cobalt-zinc-cadmium efflux system membrane fusion protein
MTSTSTGPGESPPVRRAPVTDSGWFWALLFAVMALAGIALIGPKWDWRQRQLEGRYLGREQAATERQRRAAGLEPVDLAEAAAAREAVAPERIVPAWTLACLAAAAAAGSAFMLWRERKACGNGSIRLLIWIMIAVGTGACSPPPAPAEPELRARPAPARRAGAPAPGEPAAEGPGDATAEAIEFPRASWQAAGIAIVPAAVGPLEASVSLTGRITLNEDRLAHVFPLVEGRIDEVLVGLGDRVTKGQVMAIIQSREVGKARLELVQDRLALGFARRKDQWAQTVAENTELLIELIRSDAPVEAIEAKLANRPLGEYRDKLMTAFIATAAARRNLERLTPLKAEGIVGSRQVYEAEAAWDTARATLQSLLEQLGQDARQAAMMSSQTVQELETRVATDETALEILGFSREQIAKVDAAQGEALAHCPIEAPFDGTVISKDVALLEHVGPTNQILGIADLRTVWLSADIYETQLPLVARATGQEVTFTTDAWPGRTFTATIFYTGDIVEKESRTVAMRAVADNAAGLLKPGMFVRVTLPGETRALALQVRQSAIQEHEGQSFVFVHAGGEAFERRNVTLGRRAGDLVEIVSGIAPGDQVVTGGGFALKSRLLAGLLEE